MHKKTDTPNNVLDDTAVTLSALLIETANFLGHERATAHLFANELQACAVVVKVTARNAASEIVKLPTNAIITLIPYAGNNTGWIQSTETKPPYLAYPEGTYLNGDDASQQDVADEVEVFNRYIYFPEHMAGTPRIEVAVKITLPNGVEFSTNHHDVPYGATGENGRFNSSFYLQPMIPTRYSKNDASLLIEPLPFHDESLVDNRGAGVVHTHIRLKNPSTGREVNALGSPTGNLLSATHHNKATGVVNPNASQCQHAATLNSFYSDLLNRNISPTNAIGIVVGMIAYFSSGSHLPAKQNVDYGGWRDDYGNPVNLRITLSSENPADHNMPYRFELAINGNY